MSQGSARTCTLCSVLSTFFLIAWGIALLGSGCTPPAERQTAFRIRADRSAGLNDDAGWAGALNENVTVYADQPFRLRFEIESSGDSLYRLQYRRNEGAWSDIEAADFPYPESASPRVSIVSTTGYEHGAATSDLLDGSSTPFNPGAGVSLSATTPPVISSGGQSEWEWPLVIRRFADGAVTNNEGDVFAFRMVGAGGMPLNVSAMPELSFTAPPGHLGGTFVETPGRIGPWQAGNGDLYFIMEPTETDNVLMMVRSADGGATWVEVDGTNRPAADDLEGVASAYAEGVIHILHQTSDQVWYHAFHTSDDPAQPDAWGITDERVAAPEEPPTQVASIAVRSDGSLVGVYGGPQKIHFKMRTPEGAWGEETVVDAGIAPGLSGPQVAAGADDAVHLAYTGNDGTAWYRRIQPDGTLTERVQLTTGIDTTEYDVGSVLPLVYLPDTNTAVVIYRLATGMLWERRISGDGTVSDPVQLSDRAVVQNAVDSDQAGADAVADGTTVHVLFIEQDTGHIFHTYSSETGAWSPSTLQVGGVTAQWIRGMRYARGDGARVYGYVYDAGSDGGSGMNTYAEVVLDDL